MSVPFLIDIIYVNILLHHMQINNENLFLNNEINIKLDISVLYLMLHGI